MAFPEKLLTDDEEVVEHLHPHWITLVPAALWLVLICVASGIVLAVLPDGQNRGLLSLAVLAVAVALLCWLTFTPWIRWRTTHYVVTTERVVIRQGVLRHTGRDIALGRINDVGFVLTLWDRMVRAGTLTIESAGEQGQQRLRNVPHAERLQQTINRLIDENADRRGYRGPYPEQGERYIEGDEQNDRDPEDRNARGRYSGGRRSRGRYRDD
jgi:uncharacterized membrane protein YdbT with pleckstrin-like domain